MNCMTRLKDRVDVVEAPHDTEYGMRELIIRDLNRFWITFGESLRRLSESRAARRRSNGAHRGFHRHDAARR